MALKRWQTLAIGGASSVAIAAAFLGSWEGTTTTAHFDPYAKIWDICNGHTKGVKPGDTATQAQCDAWLIEDMTHARAAVARCIHVPLNPPQEAAFISAAYNLGPSIVCGSTLQRMANAGNITGACLQLTDALNHGNYVGWTFAGGQPVQGLRNRQTEARNLCIGYFQ
jgi:lysozyme